jgi:carboxymethylenebutenolidase
MGERIEIKSGDRVVTAYRAAPSAVGPGVLVLHAWWGMTEMFTGLCDRLAAAGFVALVPDLYGGRTASTIPEAEALIGSLDWAQATQDVGAATERLLADPQTQSGHIGGIGFSMGAAVLMGLVPHQPALTAAVIFYGGSEQDSGLAERTSAAILGHFAETDDWEPPIAEVMRVQDQLRDAGMDVTFHVYPGTGHWFFEENRLDAYNPDAAAIAWERTLEFLRERLMQ